MPGGNISETIYLQIIWKLMQKLFISTLNQKVIYFPFKIKYKYLECPDVDPV